MPELSFYIGCISCCHGNGFCGIGNTCYCKKGYDEKTHCSKYSL